MSATHQNSRILQKYQQRQGKASLLIIQIQFQVSFGAIITVRSRSKAQQIIKGPFWKGREAWVGGSLAAVINKCKYTIGMLSNPPVALYVRGCLEKTKRLSGPNNIRLLKELKPQRQGGLRIHQQHQTAMVLAATRRNGISNAMVARMPPPSHSRSDFAACTSVALPFPLTSTTGSFLEVYGAGSRIATLSRLNFIFINQFEGTLLLVNVMSVLPAGGDSNG
ncbi:hypothetical protein Tco_0829375 [Tanacetum coccineum]